MKDSENIIQYYGEQLIVSSSDLFEFKLNNDGTASITLKTSVDKDILTQLILPNKYVTQTREYKVTRILKEAFSNCKNLTRVIIPDNVEFMEEAAFSECNNLKWIRLSNNLKALDENVFLNCKALKAIFIPKNINKIKKDCFLGCSSLEKIVAEGEQLFIEDYQNFFPLNNLKFEIFINENNPNFLLENFKGRVLYWIKQDGLYFYFTDEKIRIIYYDSNTIQKSLTLSFNNSDNFTIPVEIDNTAFWGCIEIEAIILDSPFLLETDVFSTCCNLADVVLLNNNVQIEEFALPVDNKDFKLILSNKSNVRKNLALQPYMILLKENQEVYNSHLFIAGVGEVELFSNNELILTSKTLIDTGITLNVNLEDIQSNGGAKLYGKYASQAGMTVKFTDAMFRMEYLAANVDSEIEISGSAVNMEHSTVYNGQVKIDGVPQPLYNEDVNNIIVWIGKQDGYSQFLSFKNDKIFKGTGEDFGKTIIKDVPFPDGSNVCVKYVKGYENGQTLVISSNYLPNEMTAILTASLFSGNQNNLEMATKVGTLTITVPRLILTGNADITLSMSGSSQMSIEGQALAVEASECDDGGYYAIVSKVIKNESWVSRLAGLAVDNANHLKYGDYLNVYGVFYGIGTRPLLKEQYVVIPSKYVDQQGIITYNGKNDLLLTVLLTEDSTKITQAIVVNT